MSAVYVSRINQLDALQLDNEIYQTLSHRAREIFRQLSPAISEKYSPEMNATLRSIIWLFSLGSGPSTFGQKLLDLSYMDLTKSKSLCFCLLIILPKYLEEKYTDPNRIPETLREKRMRRNLEMIFKIVKLLSFTNLIIFLHRGTQPVLIERFLGISSRNIAPHQPRTIGYSYMARELLWHGLMELFTVALPMFNFHYFKQKIREFFMKNKENENIIVSVEMTHDTVCPYCRNTPVLPRHAGCSHVYCYYCMSAHFQVSSSFRCFDCGVELHSDKMEIYSVTKCT
uniref:RING-type E3 ubiquitin transferase (cysteine targeting) n=1 Tax=Bracon brevicornis TaxID=1563983 RepID=A0A6V7IU45_9HYME